MKKLTITMLHILPNRVRLKLSAPIKDTKSFYSNIKNNLKYLEMKYNRRLKTVTLNFSPNEIFLQEIIYRTAISFSIENGLLPVKLIEENPSLLRRPIILDAKRMQIGFNEDEIRAFLPRSYRQQELREATLRAEIE